MVTNISSQSQPNMRTQTRETYRELLEYFPKTLFHLRHARLLFVEND